jgi:predicted amidohydrolase YtcJ
MSPQSTLVLQNARIHSLAPAGAATALAMRNGRILAIGSEGDIWSAVGSDSPVVDLRGRVVLPGFTDAHLHWASYALGRRELVLEPSQSLPEVLRRVRARAADRPAGSWIVGRGWDQARWGRWPNATDLDAAAPEHPVLLTRKDGHVVWLNSAALSRAGIGPETADPPGGEIRRHDGHPTGVLLETAVRLAYDVLPEPDRLERQAAIIDAWPDAWCRGLTGCHDMGYRGAALFRDLSTLRDAGELGLRVVWYLPQQALDEAIGLGLRTGLGDNWLRVGGLKLFLDGTLGAQTASLLAPYADQPENTGLLTIEPDRYRELLHRAAGAGLATATHAIGDRANREALAGLSAVAAAPAPGHAQLRHRIEHVQLLDPSDLDRLAALGVVASMQPLHATSDMAVAERFWGERCANAYAWRSLLDRGVTLAFGSDAPVEPLDVFAGVHAAVTRQSPSGEPRGGWHPEQRISVLEALRAYTLGPAWAAGQEEVLGSLAIGKRADLIVLDRDPLAVSPRQLLDTRVLGTMIDGVWVWQAHGTEFGGPRHEP